MSAVLLNDLFDTGHWGKKQGMVVGGRTGLVRLLLAKGDSELLLFGSEVKILFFECKSYLTLIVRILSSSP